MPFSWRRPQSLDFPLTYVKFSALDSGNSKKVTYVIQDLKIDRYEEVIGIMKDKHLLDEPMYSSKGIQKDPTSFQEMVSKWTNMLEQNISLVCFKEGSEEIVAINVLGVVTEAEFDAPHSVSMSDLLLYLYIKLSNNYSIKEEFGLKSTM